MCVNMKEPILVMVFLLASLETSMKRIPVNGNGSMFLIPRSSPMGYRTRQKSTPAHSLGAPDGHGTSSELQFSSGRLERADRCENRMRWLRVWIPHADGRILFRDTKVGCPQISCFKFNFQWVNGHQLNTKRLKSYGDGWEPPSFRDTNPQSVSF